MTTDAAHRLGVFPTNTYTLSKTDLFPSSEVLGVVGSKMMNNVQNNKHI